VKARELGFRVLWGRCLESEGVPAFWPWSQLIRELVAEIGVELAMEMMGEGATDIGTFVSEVRQQMPEDTATWQGGYPASARFRIYESINRFLQAVASTDPLLIVLDDLQWADGLSLAVLEFIASELSGSRILIIGTYRDDEVTRCHPLYGTLGELTRLVQPTRLPLKGLSRVEVGRFLAETAEFIPEANLATSLHAQTNGNPLFLSEIV